MVQTMTGASLLEREAELALLDRAWRGAVAGGGSAWLVCAEAGGGKTRLLREATRGLPLRRGAAEPVMPPDPYLAVMQALRGFRPAAHRAESVARAVETLERLAGDGPIAVLLDDLHFADEGTIAAFVRLATLCQGRPWLILGALRPGEGSETLQVAVTELIGQGVARRLDLAPLSRTAVGRLVEDVRGRAACAEEVEAIVADSGGNPWYAEALARGAGAMSAARDRILLRLDRLERAIPGARSLLAGLAPAGEPLAHAVVASLGGGDGPELRRTLRGLREAAVLRERDGTWQFAHELLRRSLLEYLLDAERREAHQRLGEALAFLVPSSEFRVGPAQLGTRNQEPGTVRRASAAAIAMHFADAGDARAGEWAVRAAEEASAVDAHAEALAQYERALAFLEEPEARRAALRAACQEAWYIGRYVDALRLAEEGLAIPGGEPELRSRLHQDAADCARVIGDVRAAAHMDAAERALDGQLVSAQRVMLAVARLWEAVALVQPERVATIAERAVCLARALENRAAGAAYERGIRCYLGLSQIDAGDPAGFAPFEALIETDCGDLEHVRREVIPQILNAYAAAVRSLFYEQAERLRRWLLDALRRHNLEWEDRAGPFAVLEMVQRGDYAAARARLMAMPAPPSRSMDGTIALFARVLYEARAGSPTRARESLAAARPPGAFAHAALVDLVLLELEAVTESGAATMRAGEIYARAEGRRFARVAGMAAVAAARASGVAPAPPAWLAEDAPLAVLWEWAAGVAGGDAVGLRAVAARLGELGRPFEAALALRDAGALAEAYQALRALGATAAREGVAGRLRAAGRPIPRGPRAETATTALTDTERAVCRLVAEGATNAAAAAALCVSARTVEAHLGRIYEKTGRRGRVALTVWWQGQARGED